MVEIKPRPQETTIYLARRRDIGTNPFNTGTSRAERYYKRCPGKVAPTNLTNIRKAGETKVTKRKGETPRSCPLPLRAIPFTRRGSLFVPADLDYGILERCSFVASPSPSSDRSRTISVAFALHWPLKEYRARRLGAVFLIIYQASSRRKADVLINRLRHTRNEGAHART